jgi:S-adenosylmethionine hydrolase
MPVFTLTTDFGLRDHYVASLKGTILRQCPQAQIIDITHQVSSFNINEAAFTLHNAYAQFPANTLHLVSVESFEAVSSRYIALERNGHFFIGPDNGIFSLAFHETPQQAAELIDGATAATSPFPIKDYLVGTACQLASSQDVFQFGEKVTNLARRTSLQPVRQESMIRGTIIHIDAFENAITNIDRELFNTVAQGRNFVLTYRGRDTIEKLNGNYCEALEGEVLCMFNTSGYLEIAIKKGKASSLLGLSVNDTVQIDFS